MREDAPLETLLGNEALRRLGALVATDADGRLRGVVTVDQIGRALQDPAPQAPSPSHALDLYRIAPAA